jgi:hypothetical protein
MKKKTTLKNLWARFCAVDKYGYTSCDECVNGRDGCCNRAIMESAVMRDCHVAFAISGNPECRCGHHYK